MKSYCPESHDTFPLKGNGFCKFLGRVFLCSSCQVALCRCCGCVDRRSSEIKRNLLPGKRGWNRLFIASYDGQCFKDAECFLCTGLLIRKCFQIESVVKEQNLVIEFLCLLKPVCVSEQDIVSPDCDRIVREFLHLKAPLTQNRLLCNVLFRL